MNGPIKHCLILFHPRTLVGGSLFFSSLTWLDTNLQRKLLPHQVFKYDYILLIIIRRIRSSVFWNSKVIQLGFCSFELHQLFLKTNLSVTLLHLQTHFFVCYSYIYLHFSSSLCFLLSLLLAARIGFLWVPHFLFITLQFGNQ